MKSGRNHCEHRGNGSPGRSGNRARELNRYRVGAFPSGPKDDGHLHANLPGLRARLFYRSAPLPVSERAIGNPLIAGGRLNIPPFGGPANFVVAPKPGSYPRDDGSKSHHAQQHGEITWKNPGRPMAEKFAENAA